MIVNGKWCSFSGMVFTILGRLERGIVYVMKRNYSSNLQPPFQGFGEEMRRVDIWQFLVDSQGKKKDFKNRVNRGM